MRAAPGQALKNEGRIAAHAVAPSIVVLDGHTLNPGDLSWASLEALGSCRIFPRTSPHDIATRAEGARILLTNKTLLSAATLRELPELEFVSVLATGTNVVDLSAATALGIVVSNVPSYAAPSVAQATFALLFELVQRTSLYNRSVHAGEWSRQQDFSYLKAPLEEVAGKQLGIVGYGAIGRQVARIAAAFDMEVVVWTRTHQAELGSRQMDLGTLFRTSDVVSLHCPLTAETHGLVNRERLEAMKPGALLLNTSRGGLIDEEALGAALRAGTLAGAGLDVLAEEPPRSDHPLFSAPNCVITPHIGWATRASRARLLGATVENVRAYLRGSPIHVVAP